MLEKNVSEFATEAQRLIKIMQGDYALPLNTGSKLLGKLTKSSSEYFKRKSFAMLDEVTHMEQQYKLLDPKSITVDPQ
jgi:hypothetical protein